MIHLAVGRGPSPLFGTAKLDTKKECMKFRHTLLTVILTVLTVFLTVLRLTKAFFSVFYVFHFSDKRIS